MQKCSSCEADLPENSRFCGKCGSVQDSISIAATTTRSNTPQQQSWTPEDGTIPATWPPSSNDPVQGSAPAWSPNVQAPETPPPPLGAENEDERRRGIPPWSPLYGSALAGGALLGSVQAYTPGVPVVQGTPQIGSVPSVAGSPTPYINARFSQPVQGAGNAPVSQPVQGTQPTHHPPERPEAPEHHPPHKPHRHQTHPLQHEPHRVVKTKAAGASSVKTIMIVVATVVVVAAGGIAAAAHFLSRPQPLISISSNFKVGTTPAGANGTILHISGQQFSSNSAITFLLDGNVAPGNPGTQSDSNGNFSADVTITGAWSVGTHTLTAMDASNASTTNSVSVTIVQPGQANTPGPTPTPPAVFNSGTWQGQGTYNDGRPPFDMTLMITVNGNSFSGTLRENMYNTTVNIIGAINGDTFSFTDPTYVSGNQITLGTTYTGTVSNGSMRGTWVFPNPQDGSGAFSLNLTS
jgi:hypothetical protein